MYFDIELDEGRSSFVKGFRWENNDLILRFKDNRKYCYHGVPKEIVEKFILAESFGKFIHENIKDKYKGEPVNAASASSVNL